jgi:hypothetical protein
MAREWPVVMRQLWTDSRWVNSAEDVETAVDGLQASFGERYMPDNAELVAALRWMAEGREWTQKKAPSLRELIIAIRVRRKGMNAPDGKSGAVKNCGLCVSGWLLLEEPNRESSVPCVCAAGDHWMGVCEDYRDLSATQRESFDRLRRQAANQARAKGGES